MRYYNITHMDTPTQEMYSLDDGERVLLVGTAKPQIWATTVDIDPDAPADIVADGCNLPFESKYFDVAILDFTSNFVKPRQVSKLIREANRVAKIVKGRCHIGDQVALKGPKQRFPHKTVPKGVTWVETKEA